jgi:hypothetical protein
MSAFSDRIRDQKNQGLYKVADLEGGKELTHTISHLDEAVKMFGKTVDILNFSDTARQLQLNLTTAEFLLDTHAERKAISVARTHLREPAMTDAQALRHQLRAAGYCPIPLYGKEPPIYGKNNQRKGLKDWEQLWCDLTPEQIDWWTKMWPDAINKIKMRAELAQMVGALISNASKTEHQLSEDEIDKLIKAADIVTCARTGVERDYKGEVIDAHAPEMPTRFAKQLTQLIRGAVAIGVSKTEAMRLAIRCARDSIPPLRREILLDIAAHPESQPPEVHRRIGRPRNTVRRELEALYMLRLLQCDEEDEEQENGRIRTTLHYSLGDNFDEETLKRMTAPAAKS